MSIVELIPLNKGNSIILDDTNITTLGRTPDIGCTDNKISRNHTQLFIKSDGTLWIKSIHHNPTFYKTKNNQIVILTKDKEYQLYNNDQFGLLPDEYFYRVSIKSKDEEVKKTSDHNQTVILKSSVKENEILTIENTELTRETTITTPSVKERTYTEEKKAKRLVYDDNEESTAVISATAQAGTSNNVDLTTNSPTSSIVVDPTKRERCPYGESCYRTNLIHRQQAIHPGDPDWNTKENDKNKTRPECPYGNECYRTNPDHFNEYHHPKQRSIEIKDKLRRTKRKASEDDDGLPNEYDYNDSFIDDERLDSDTTNDEEESIQSDNGSEWKPDENSPCANEIDDESSEESERDLTNQEAAEFIKDSTDDCHGPVIKKPRIQDEDEN